MGQGRQSRTVETLSLVLHAPACQGLEHFFSFPGWSAVIRLSTFRNIRFMSELIPQLTQQLFNGLSLGAIYRSEEHTSELQSLMRISYAVFCLKKKKTKTNNKYKQTPRLTASNQNKQPHRRQHDDSTSEHKNEDESQITN